MKQQIYNKIEHQHKIYLYFDVLHDLLHTLFIATVKVFNFIFV